jgi:hypothetical protein
VQKTIEIIVAEKQLSVFGVNADDVPTYLALVASGFKTSLECMIHLKIRSLILQLFKYLAQKMIGVGHVKTSLSEECLKFSHSQNV